MTRKFKITYLTSWGEEIKFVFGEERADMQYLPGGVWEIDIDGSKIKAGTEYHYECWKDGRRLRREWRDHVVPAGKTGTVEVNDQWADTPADAPFYTSAFADKVFSINQDDAKFRVNADVTPQEMYRSGWKCAGTAVPVFSLRTEDSFGIGDFHDLKKLADWVAATGQRVIQLLPVNDTTMTGTWKDSYPYSANSIYALHPQFVYLPDAGVRRDAKYKALKAELEALTEIDYERVNQEKDRLMRKAFASTWAKVSVSAEYRKFIKDNAGWLDAYCAFRILLHKTGTGDSTKWGKYATYSAKKAAAVLAENREEADYQSFVQFHLHKQLVDARNYARKQGVTFKGDLPIGVSRTSVDAWQNPSQFNMNSQAGAPPDPFSADGQMWGFPTYNWDKMEEDNFAWWKARLKNMEQYFDFFRIDHILGFFRIWEIPANAKSGLLGHFFPALPYSAKELADNGFDINSGWYTSDGVDTLFLEDPRKPGYWHPRIAGQDTEHYRRLPDWQKDAALIGIPVARLAWESIRMPDNWHIMAPNMLIGMTIGLLGVVSARRRVLAYTDPGRAVRTAYTTAASQTAQANEAAGFAVPQSFTVEERKGVKITLRITGAMFILVSLVLLIGSVMESAAVGLDGESAAVLAVSFLVLLCAGICLPFLARRKMEVEGSVIRCRPAFGRARTFQISEIAGMRSRFNGRQLIGRDGAVLARFEDNQKNGAILLQYLSEHGVGLLAE